MITKLLDKNCTLELIRILLIRRRYLGGYQFEYLEAHYDFSKNFDKLNSSSEWISLNQMSAIHKIKKLKVLK